MGKPQKRELIVDFLNLDLSRKRTVGYLALGIVDFYKRMLLFREGFWSNPRSVRHTLRNQVLQETKDLERVQREFKLDYNSDRDSGVRGEKADRIWKNLLKIGTTKCSVLPNFRIDDILCFVLSRPSRQALSRCKTCNRFFLDKLMEQWSGREQLYCSDKCRWRGNNERRIKSGEHTSYMRKWREKGKMGV